MNPNNDMHQTNSYDSERPQAPAWALVILVLLTLAPVAVILYDTIQDMPAVMRLMRAISDPDVGTGAKVYAILIGMLLWLVTVPLTVIYGIVLAVSHIAAHRRGRSAQNRGEII
jgi:ABC-type sulfate transport system permease subunit